MDCHYYRLAPIAPSGAPETRSRSAEPDDLPRICRTACHAGADAGRRGTRAHRPRRGGADRAEDGVRPRCRQRRRAAADAGQGVAHLLAQSRRFRIADDARLETAGGHRRRTHRVAAAACAAGGAAHQLRLRGRRIAPGHVARDAGVCRRGAGDARRARRLARVPRDVHSRGRRSHARVARRARRRRRSAQRRADHCRAGDGSRDARRFRMECRGAWRRPARRRHADAADRRRRSGRAALLPR